MEVNGSTLVNRSRLTFFNPYISVSDCLSLGQLRLKTRQLFPTGRLEFYCNPPIPRVTSLIHVSVLSYILLSYDPILPFLCEIADIAADASKLEWGRRHVLGHLRYKILNKGSPHDMMVIQARSTCSAIAYRDAVAHLQYQSSPSTYHFASISTPSVDSQSLTFSSTAHTSARPFLSSAV